MNNFLIFYLCGGIITVIFIISYPLLYLKMFHRALLIFKTVTFKLNIDKDSSFSNSKIDKEKKLKENQEQYQEHLDMQIKEEQEKPLDNPVQATIKIMTIILGWSLILGILLLAEFLRIFYLSPSDLENL